MGCCCLDCLMAEKYYEKCEVAEGRAVESDYCDVCGAKNDGVSMECFISKALTSK